MNIDQFEEILYDTYEMDLYLPQLRPKYKTLYKEMSYKQWAVDEVKRYVERNLGHNYYADISDYIEWVTNFIAKMSEYEIYSKNTALIFNVAKMTALDIKDLLIAMI